MPNSWILKSLISGQFLSHSACFPSKKLVLYSVLTNFEVIIIYFLNRHIYDKPAAFLTYQKYLLLSSRKYHRRTRPGWHPHSTQPPTQEPEDISQPSFWLVKLLWFVDLKAVEDRQTKISGHVSLNSRHIGYGISEFQDFFLQPNIKERSNKLSVSE